MENDSQHVMIVLLHGSCRTCIVGVKEGSPPDKPASVLWIMLNLCVAPIAHFCLLLLSIFLLLCMKLRVDDMEETKLMVLQNLFMMHSIYTVS